MKALFNDNQFFCPMCSDYFEESEYLKEVIENEKTLWLANMVTHYRHNHIKSWNRCWADGGNRYRYGWFGDYEEEKSLVNERAKRQIIRKCGDYLTHHGIAVTDYEGLQYNSPETIDLAKKKLPEK
jgi:hypothetical protein